MPVYGGRAMVDKGLLFLPRLLNRAKAGKRCHVRMPDLGQELEGL